MLKAGAAINRHKVFGHVPGIDVNDRWVGAAGRQCNGVDTALSFTPAEVVYEMRSSQLHQHSLGTT